MKADRITIPSRRTLNAEIARATRFVLTFAFAISAIGLSADVKLPGIFSDHMVLQHGRTVPVWGWADEGEQISVSFRDQTLETTARNGRWSVQLAPLKPGGPDDLVIRGATTIKLQNVLAGEVWVGSGQSNMEWALRRSSEPENAIANSNHPEIRLFTVPKRKADEPVDNVDASWVVCSPETSPSFSAVAYYFGRDLQQSLGIPVGLIHTSWGGSPAEVWISSDVLQANAEHQQEILAAHEEAFKRYQNALAEFERAQANPSTNQANRRRPNAPWKPSELYNGMIAPIVPFAIAGVIWYQGESNASRAEQYRTLFPNMIANWRQAWGQGDFPFLAVQLAPWDKNRRRSLEEIAATPGESEWAELREAQMHATQVLPRTGLAVIIDAGDKDDIHPQQKEPVGKRLALLARAIAYGHDIVHSGPIFHHLEIRDGKAIVHFTHTGSGLKAQNGPLKGFAIAGKDKRFVWADATIQGDTVVVGHPDIKAPVAVRYGWADFPIVNLFNEEGLPASPFRTDEYPRR